MLRRVFSAILFILLATQLAAQSVPDRREVITRDVDFYGSDLQPLFDTTLEACQRVCLADTACGAFTFNTAVTDGTGYSATVLTQPTNPNQECIVTNASGTVGGANVSDIAVNCTTESYRMGGRVRGLSGSGLVLQNNGTWEKINFGDA